ncbi:hypothetical protein Tco_1052664, partial [Tanacetum coccineum]
LHTSIFDQLHAYLEQHELHANEVCIMRERNQDPLALVANHQMTPSHFNTYQSSYNNPQFQQHVSPSQTPQYGSIHPTQHYSTTYPSIPRTITYPSTSNFNAYSSTVHQDIDSGLAVHIFKQGDDPIDDINKMMSFLSTLVTSCFPTTNNQLINSSNLRQQATIHDGRVTVQPVQGRQRSYGKTIAKAKEEKGCYITLELQKVQLHRRSLHTIQLIKQMISHNAAYQADDLDYYDSDCDDFSTDKAILIANLSSYGSDVLSEDGSVIAKETNVISIVDPKETLMLDEESRSKMILKQNIVNIVVNSSMDMNTSVNVHSAVAMNDSVNYVENCNKCVELEPELKDEKFKGNDIVDNAAQVLNATTIAPRMYKLDPVTLASKDKNNRETHIYYLKHTLEQAAILREIVEQAKSLNPSDSASYSACKYVKLIQELLGYVRDT